MAIEEVLSRLPDAESIGRAKWRATCPAHEDSDPSLDLWEKSDGKVVMTCRAGCAPEEVREAIGLPWSAFGSDTQVQEPRAAYVYETASGEEHHRVDRWFDSDGNRHFAQYCRNGGSDWVKGAPPREERELYSLPEVLNAVEAGEEVWLVEGEKDADRLRSAGVCATTAPGGANAPWLPQYSEALRNARVLIVADRDEPGLRHALKVFSALRPVSASVEIREAAEGNDVSDHLDAGLTLDALVSVDPASLQPEASASLGAPLSVAELRKVEAPVEEWRIERLVPAAANVLTVGYPKTFKTMLLLEWAVTMALGELSMGRFAAPERSRVGLVLMEDHAHRVRNRIERLLEGRDRSWADMEGYLYLWFRPPFRFNPKCIDDLAGFVESLALDVVWVDSWAYAARGDSNDADWVTQQLQHFNRLREVNAKITLGLTHHARKESGTGGPARITDRVRNSSALGAWYDAGILLDRKDERAPVSVRGEFRDYLPLDPFTFTVEDEHPGDSESGVGPSGSLRLIASSKSPEAAAREEARDRVIPAVAEFLREHPGAGKREIEEAITGRRDVIDAAIESLKARGEVRVKQVGRKHEHHLANEEVPAQAT